MNSLRATFKYSGWSQKNQVINGTIPGFNDSKQYKPVVSTWAATGNYTFNPTTFLEATYGHSQNELTGCGLAQGGTGPTFCQNGFAMNPIGNRFNAGLGNIPFLFPDANVIDPSYYAFEALSGVNPPNFVDGRVVVPPNFAWGSRVSNNNPNYAPPNTPFPGFLNINATDDISISLTKVAGRHTIKSGFYNTHSYKAQQRGGWNGTITFANDNNNPIDSTFGYANAALGIFSQYAQASKYVEGSFVYNNTEAYIQDNWKVTNNLTLDYGVRFVHQQPQYDDKGQASNFLPEKWAAGQAPQLYLAGCPNNVNPCAAASRQAMNPQTGQLLGPGTNVAIGALVPNSGNTLNGLFLSGQGIAETTYTWPALAIAPRFGMAYDVTGQQKMVLRGGAGLFFDRPSGNSIYSQVQNPPTYTSITVRNAQLQTLANAGTIAGAPALNVFEYAGNLPSSTQWNGGLQMALPWSSALDVEYVGQHSFNTLDGVDINAIDFGAAFLPQNQDPTLQPNTTPGAMAVAQDQMRAFRGYAGITQQWGRGWRTFHSLQLSFNRRFKDGLSFGFNDTIVLSDQPEHRRAAAAQRRRHVCAAKRSGSSGRAAWHRYRQPPPLQGQLRVGHARHPVRRIRPQGPGGDRKRLAGFGRMDSCHGQCLYRRLQLPERRGQREPDGLAELRRADPCGGRSGKRLQQQRLPAVQHVRVPGPVDQQRRPRVGCRLSAGMFYERAGSLHRAQYPFGRRPEPSVAGRPVQRAQLGDNHGTQYDDEPVEPERPGDGNESAVRREPAT